MATLAYRTALERAGYVVQTAGDGLAGLEALQRSVPDGILLDLMMPRLGGAQLLQALRAQHHLAAVPVIAYTNAFIPSLVSEATAAGATQVFSKSELTPHVLIRVFDGLIPSV